jgi:hypothetical protein
MAGLTCTLGRQNSPRPDYYFQRRRKSFLRAQFPTQLALGQREAEKRNRQRLREHSRAAEVISQFPVQRPERKCPQCELSYMATNDTASKSGDRSNPTVGATLYNVHFNHVHFKANEHRQG